MPQGSYERTIRVALIVDEDSNPFEVGCACEIFGISRRAEVGYEPYEMVVVTPGHKTTMRDGMFSINARGRLADVARADLVIVPNRPHVDRPSRPAVLTAIRRAHARGARLVGLCTGAFTLAEAGVLDNRRATVHWQLATEFQNRFPAVRLEPNVLFVDDGDVLTSAGSAAALDLGLHIVRRDHGTHVANHIGRRLVFAAYRDGGQQQFIEQPVPPPVTVSLAPTLDWAKHNLHRKLTVDDLAQHARITPGTLHRRFRREIGSTPLAWLTTQRVALACRLIEQGANGVESVAHHAGLGTGANLRHVFHKHLGLSPTDYRKRFTTP